MTCIFTWDEKSHKSMKNMGMISIYGNFMENFYGMIKMINYGQTQGSILLISNFRNQSEELCESQELF